MFAASASHVEAQYLTVYEVAAIFRCGHRKIARLATQQGVGVQLGGSAGWRFTAEDIDALRKAMRPKAPAKPDPAATTSKGSSSPKSHRKSARSRGTR